MRQLRKCNRMGSSIKFMSMVLVFVFVLTAEKMVFEDASFPYRVVCEPGWEEVVKNDSVLILDNITSEKKTRMELYRVTIDTSGMTKNIDWAQFKFSVNKNITYSFGRLIFFDTAATKQLGGYRAYELFTINSDSSKTTWWGQYDRWAENGAYGYFASIFGDTANMKENLPEYIELMDSISFVRMNTPVVQPELNRYRNVSVRRRETDDVSLPWHDLLGRELINSQGYRNRLLVGKNTRQCPVR